jgi:hypothetical protein
LDELSAIDFPTLVHLASRQAMGPGPWKINRLTVRLPAA